MPDTRIYWLHALSPTHAGTGRGVGYIDLPIDRDGVTGWPILRGSAFKGVWRDWAVQEKLANIDLAFGRASDTETQNSNSGALIPTDAQLVCLPVRSFRGTFALATSPLCLQMFQRTLALAGAKPPDGLPAPKEPDDRAGRLGEACCVGETLTEAGGVYLEDLDFKAVPDDKSTNEWAGFIGERVFPDDPAWREQFKKRFVVLPDAAFDFLCETGTEVQTRVKISDDTKTVETGALWTEESLPAETILAGIIQCERVFRKDGAEDDSITRERLITEFATKPLPLQIGGKATVGRGRMRCVFTSVNGGGR